MSTAKNIIVKLKLKNIKLVLEEYRAKAKVTAKGMRLTCGIALTTVYVIIVFVSFSLFRM